MKNTDQVCDRIRVQPGESRREKSINGIIIDWIQLLLREPPCL